MTMDADNDKDMGAECTEALQTPDTKLITEYVKAAGIREAALGEIVTKLREQDLTPNTMRLVTTPDLENIGIAKLAHRIKLRRYSASLPALTESQPSQEVTDQNKPLAQAVEATAASSLAEEFLAEEVTVPEQMDKKPPAVTLDILDMIRGLRDEIHALRNPTIGHTTDPHMQSKMEELESLLVAKKRDQEKNQEQISASVGRRRQ